MGLSEKLSVSSGSSFMVEPHCVNEMLYQTKLITPLFWKPVNINIPASPYFKVFAPYV